MTGVQTCALPIYVLFPSHDMLVIGTEIDYVIPVPISKERERERGFNQVEDILINAGINYLKAERKVNTKHMYKILNKNRRSECGDFFNHL